MLVLISSIINKVSIVNHPAIFPVCGHPVNQTTKFHKSVQFLNQQKLQSACNKIRKTFSFFFSLMVQDHFLYAHAEIHETRNTRTIYNGFRLQTPFAMLSYDQYILPFEAVINTVYKCVCSVCVCVCVCVSCLS